jgi:dihydrofolate reductase
MRKIINSTYISIDGAIEEPHLWPALDGPSDPRADEIQTELLLACDAVLMGRRTYDGFAPVWPTRSGDPASDQMNSMRKYVVSSTLRDPEWNNTHVVDGDVAAELTKLKQSPGKDIVQYGIGPVTRTLIDHDLLDEVRLWVHPLVIGTDATPDDMPLRAWPAAGFRLTNTAPLSNGIVILTYSVHQ